MKQYSVENMRNVVIIGHGGGGKTSLTEAMLFLAKATDRMGRTEEGNTVTDFEPEEIDRKSSISSAAAFYEWGGCKTTIVDTPGYINFIEDAKACIRAVDGAILVGSPISGIKAETMKVWGYANEFGLPRMIFVGKMDKERADFSMFVSQCADGFCKEAVPVMMPIGEEASFKGVVDIIKMTAYMFEDGEVGKFSEVEIPAELREQAGAYRLQLVEKVAEVDDAMLEKYLEIGELCDDDVLKCLRVGVLDGTIVPILCGAPPSGIGVPQLMDAICDLIPNPKKRIDAIPINATNPDTGDAVELKTDDEGPLAAVVFKTIADPYAGKLSLFRVVSGTFKSDSTVHNTNKDKEERIGQLYYLMGKKQVPAQILKAGEIGAVAKLKDTVTGDSLCDKANPILFEAVKRQEPVMSFAIESKNKGDEDKVSIGITRLIEEDPTLKFVRNDETKEMILSGMGQLHLEITLEKLKRKFGAELVMKTPKIPYKETIRGTTKIQGRHKKQSGGRGQFGDCWIELEPLPSGGGFEFVNNIVGGAIPRQYIPAVEKGIVESMSGGVIAGYPVVDVRATLYDGSFHNVDSSEMAFKIAGSMAFKKGVLECKPVLLEPVMNVSVLVPEDTMGNVIGDLNSRRGKVQGMDAEGINQKVTAQVPMAEMMSYAPTLNSLTSGRGMYTMEFSHYEELPAHLTEKVAGEAKAAREDSE
jgi:elongation factor G